MATAEALEPGQTADVYDLASLVLNALAGRKRVVVPVGHLGTSLGLGEALEDALRELQALGLVYLWSEAPGGLSASLTPLAAERAGLKLVAGQWRPKGSKEPAPQRKRTRTITEADLPHRKESDGSLPYCFEEMADRKAIDPASVVESLDVAPLPEGFRGDYLVNRPPTPKILLGLRLQWPVEPAEVCPGCGGRRLSVVTYCCLCDRAGAFERVGRIKQV